MRARSNTQESKTQQVFDAYAYPKLQAKPLDPGRSAQGQKNVRPTQKSKRDVSRESNSDKKSFLKHQQPLTGSKHQSGGKHSTHIVTDVPLAISRPTGLAKTSMAGIARTFEDRMDDETKGRHLPHSPIFKFDSSSSAEGVDADLSIKMSLFRSVRGTIDVLFKNFTKGDDISILHRRVLETVDSFENDESSSARDKEHVKQVGPNDARKLSSCNDFPEWTDSYGWDCADYSRYDQCGGNKGGIIVIRLFLHKRARVFCDRCMLCLRRRSIQ